MISPPARGLRKKVLDRKAAHRTIKATLGRESSSQGETGSLQGASGGVSVKKGTSGNASTDTTSRGPSPGLHRQHGQGLNQGYPELR